MKRLLVIFALLLTFSSSAWAEWVVVSGNADGSTIQYADPETIRKNGSMVKVWALTDYLNAHVSKSSGKTYFSAKGQIEYDCQGESMRILTDSWHSDHMGGGDVIFVYNGSPPDEWSPVAPGSVGEGMWKFACGN